jgi:hypothetical protein
MYPGRRQGVLTWSDNQLSDQFVHYHNKIGGVPGAHKPATARDHATRGLTQKPIPEIWKLAFS